MTTTALTAVAGFVAGGMTITLSHLALRLGAKHGARDLDDLRLFGRAYSHGIAHALGIAIHLALFLLAGTVFGLLVQLGMITHSVTGLAVYVLVLELVFGGIILPLEGHGLFGAREDAWFAIDLLIMNTIWVMLFEAVYRLLVLA